MVLFYFSHREWVTEDHGVKINSNLANLEKSISSEDDYVQDVKFLMESDFDILMKLTSLVPLQIV